MLPHSAHMYHTKDSETWKTVKDILVVSCKLKCQICTHKHVIRDMLISKLTRLIVPWLKLMTPKQIITISLKTINRVNIMH